MPEVHYARSGGVAIAYQVVGEGPHTLVYVPPVANLYSLWELPRAASFLRRLSEEARVVVLNPRGTGLSDRPSNMTLESRVDDTNAVLDAVEQRRGTIFGGDVSASVCAFANRLSRPPPQSIAVEFSKTSSRVTERTETSASRFTLTSVQLYRMRALAGDSGGEEAADVRALRVDLAGGDGHRPSLGRGFACIARSCEQCHNRSREDAPARRKHHFLSRAEHTRRSWTLRRSIGYSSTTTSSRRYRAETA